MIDALVAGTLYGRAQSRTSKNGQPYVTAKVRTPMRDGESLFINVVAFSASVVQALLALDEHDAVALVGELKASAYLDKSGQPRPSVDLLAHGVVTAYHITRTRQAMKRAKGSGPELPQLEPAPEARSDQQPAPVEQEFNDALPF